MTQHWQQLVSIDKADLAQELYVRHVGTRLHATLAEHSHQQTVLLAWLPGWHAALLAFVTSESDWLRDTLPQQHPVLLLQALSVALKTCMGCVADPSSLGLPPSLALLPWTSCLGLHALQQLRRRPRTVCAVPCTIARPSH